MPDLLEVRRTFLIIISLPQNINTFYQSVDFSTAAFKALGGTVQQGVFPSESSWSYHTHMLIHRPTHLFLLSSQIHHRELSHTRPVTCVIYPPPLKHIFFHSHCMHASIAFFSLLTVLTWSDQGREGQGNREPRKRGGRKENLTTSPVGRIHDTSPTKR